ncbi:GxxExxY protein [Candidatus Falkowbacteria bacterium CG10_big_fil_rev_8_21_14_0_10_43_10]|uniref:GxxExxY protein n=1 Tax=Candidatus Falkowbacteria bacterium CG10_big_fil_rev_8_21_14_0_10_43_10 TaxID=1974567 RepID=A0A2H0V2E5_9BACT|nr:MAG: GxxExxY protein [Candidatus Falkowbacteria bacterium CG10_big_fil_rev_8_21_14_0_10_43_10]
MLLYQKEGVEVIYPRLSYKIVGILFDVFNELGYGYQEKFYERATEKYLIKRNINYQKQKGHKVYINREFIGIYYLDFLIDDKIILELKKGNYFPKQNIDQVNAYLHATGLKLGILANFTSTGVKYKRLLNIK